MDKKMIPPLIKGFIDKCPSLRTIFFKTSKYYRYLKFLLFQSVILLFASQLTLSIFMPKLCSGIWAKHVYSSLNYDDYFQNRRIRNTRVGTEHFYNE